MSTTEMTTEPVSEVPDGEKHWTIQDQPGTQVSAIPLDGQPTTDKAFVTEGGAKFRARIVRIATQETRAPTNGDVRIAPSGINLSLTLAALDDDMEVMKDPTGAYIITDVHEVVWTDAAYRNPAFDPAADLDRIIREQAYILETRIQKRSAVADLLSSWGGAPAEALELSRD